MVGLFQLTSFFQRLEVRPIFPYLLLTLLPPKGTELYLFFKNVQPDSIGPPSFPLNSYPTHSDRMVVLDWRKMEE